MLARRRASATTAMCFPRRATMRRAQARSASASGGPAAQEGDGGLNQEPAGAWRPGFRDGAAVLRVARAALAWPEAEVRLKLVRVVKAPDVVDRGDKGGGGDGPDAGHGAEALGLLIVSRPALDRRVGIHELAIEGPHDGEERGDQREPWPRQG